MRKIGWFVTSVALILMAVALVEGQQGEKKKTGGGGGGGFGGFGQQKQDALTLLNNQQVKKELALTDEQMQKIPAEVMLAIAKVLDEKQMKRLRQIELQQRGNEAFKDETVIKTLKITPEQKTKIADVLAESSKELAELAPKKGGGGGGGDFKAIAEKRETIRKETTEKINTVLTTEQQKAWTEMLGEELKLQRAGFGAGGGGTKKKKDTE